jgi:hypothetical protein
MDPIDRETPDDDQEFLARLPSHPIAGPRSSSQVVVVAPPTLDGLFADLASAPPGWVWRGQSTFSWHLQTRLSRAFSELPPHADPAVSYDYIGLENKVIGFFKERARRATSTAPDDLDLLSWLATMQHYGAPTRLLDWSESPFVALWFACESIADEDSALWALNAYMCRREITGSLLPGGWDHLGVITHSTTDAEGATTTRTPALEVRHRDRENHFLRWAIRMRSKWPLPLVPFDSDPRMSAQQTVLACIGDLTEPVDQLLLRYDEWQSERAAEPPPGGYRLDTLSSLFPLTQPADLIRKFLIPRDWRLEALNRLGTMGIDASTLFPGLDGVGRETSMYLSRGRGTLREVITDTFGA